VPAHQRRWADSACVVSTNGPRPQLLDMTQTPKEAQRQPGLPDHPAQSARWGRRPNTRLLATAGAVVVLLVAGIVWSASQRPHDAQAGPRPPEPAASDIRTATRFVGALSLFDLHRVRELLAPGATFTGAVDTGQWALAMRFFHETGGQILPGPCYALSQASSEAVVDCPYRYQLMRSGDLGLGPYTGSNFEITTRDGRVTAVNMDHETDTNGWSTQMWMPFAAWIDSFHHADGAMMYPDWPQQHHWPATKQAIRLWSLRTRQFVQYVHHLCSTPRGQHAAVCSGEPHAGDASR
jgi:hypothetical protein